MQANNFRLITTLQLVLLLYDMILNSIINLILPPNVVQLVLFILQDICIVFQLIILSLEFFNTYVFQAGFASIIFRKFRASLIVTVIYLFLSIGLHIYTLTLRWDNVAAYVWANGGFYTIYIIQRGFSPLYYYYYKRAALKMCDPRFYYNSEWLKTQWMSTT